MTKYQRKILYGLIRELLCLRDGERCLKCGKVDRLQMSHIYPKGTHRKMEFEPENLKLLCVGCHLYWWHKNPIEAHEWLRRKIPKKRLDRLSLMANTVNKTPFDYKANKLWLEAEIQRLKNPIVS